MKIEQKVMREEWEEITLNADEFFLHQDCFRDEDGCFSYHPTLTFEHGKEFVDESWGIDEKGYMFTSSYQSGVTNYHDNQYKSFFLGHEKPLGQFVSITFNLNDELKQILIAAGVL